jgi:hypothetical protein
VQRRYRLLAKLQTRSFAADCDGNGKEGVDGSSVGGQTIARLNEAAFLGENDGLACDRGAEAWRGCARRVFGPLTKSFLAISAYESPLATGRVLAGDGDQVAGKGDETAF